MIENWITITTAITQGILEAKTRPQEVLKYSLANQGLFPSQLSEESTRLDPIARTQMPVAAAQRPLRRVEVCSGTSSSSGRTSITLRISRGSD
jgi:hypothetical protein